ncbi:hypothetical protein KXX11_008651, partial [Aspergillus fumigatus]
STCSPPSITTLPFFTFESTVGIWTYSQQARVTLLRRPTRLISLGRFSSFDGRNGMTCLTRRNASRCFRACGQCSTTFCASN